jgi:hypothetical protein
MEKVLQTWLDHQCRMLTGSIRAVLLTGPPDQGPYNQVLFWQDDRRDHAMLSRVAQMALRNKKNVIKPLSNQGENTAEQLDVLACPLFLEDKLLGSVAIEITHRSLSRLRAAAQQVQAGARWIKAMMELSLDPALGSKKKRDHQPFAKKIFEPVQIRCAKLLGPRRLLLKVSAGLTALLLVGFFLVSTMLRVPSDSESEAVNRYAVVAPQQRYIINVQERSGDSVGDGGTVMLNNQEPPIDEQKSETETTTTNPTEELYSIEIGPILREQELKKATSILHGNGFDSHQTLGVGAVKVTRLLEGLYTREMAHKRFKAIQNVVDSAFMISEKGKLAIYVGTYHNRAMAIQKIKQLAQKNIKVTAVTTELKMKGAILVVKQVDRLNIETITDQMSVMGLSVKVIKSG